MKTSLRALFFTAFICFQLTQVYSQCTVSKIFIQHVTVVGSTPTSCTVKFDASFNIENNNGNKFIFIHAWIESDYPDYFECENGHSGHPGAIQAPDAGDLGNSFLNIGINNSGASPVVITVYPPDNSVAMTSIDSVRRTVAPDGSGDFILFGIQTTLPVACGTPVIIAADLWSSQSAAAQVAHCVNCGILYSSGYLTVVGGVNCATLSYSATITNNTSQPVTGWYHVYADVNGDGYFSPVSDTLIQDSTAFSVAAGPGTTTAISGPVPPANMNQDLFIVLSQYPSGASRVVLLPSTQCSPLPVTFRSFKAARVSQDLVALRWETATEINNSGFALLRNTGNGWEFVEFLPSLALDGNSSSVLTYSYMDRNSFTGITQYRIRQVDLDGKFKYSDIRAVRGEWQKDQTIVYPNPTINGQVNVLFEDKDGTRSIALIDSYGRTIRQWKGLNSNTLIIDNLRQGIYTLRIITEETRQQQVEKIVVLK
jgi:hypothetical protein